MFENCILKAILFMSIAVRRDEAESAIYANKFPQFLITSSPAEVDLTMLLKIIYFYLLLFFWGGGKMIEGSTLTMK